MILFSHFGVQSRLPSSRDLQNQNDVSLAFKEWGTGRLKGGADYQLS
jgi:hypothetical protein